MSEILLSDCDCADTFKLHDLEFSLAECTMMFVEHFGEVVMPGGGNYREMMLAVADKVGWHHVIEDINKLRTEKPDYVGGSVATWGGFCFAAPGPGMSVIVINHQRSSSEHWSIHKTGCRDIKRTFQETAGVSGGKFDSVADALAETIDDEMIEMGFSEDDVKIYNCVS